MGLLGQDLLELAQIGGAGAAGSPGESVIDKVFQRYLQQKYPTMANPSYGTPGFNPYATPPFNPNSPIDTSVLDKLSAQNKADEGLADKFLRPLFGKLGPVGNIGNKGLDILGEVQGAARQSALRGGLGAIAPNFSKGVMAASQLEVDNAYKRALTERVKQQSAMGGGGQRRVHSAQVLENGNIGYLDAFTGEVVDTGKKAGSKTQIVDVPGIGKFIFDPIQKTMVPVADEETVTAGLGERKKAEAQGSAEGQAEVKNQQTLPEEIAKDQEFIDRAQMFVDMLKSNDLETGPLAGRLPALTTNQQLFDAFSGENIIQSISQATFGQLSEGERQFIKSTNPNRTLTEEANINIIERKIDMIKRAQNRAREKLGQEPVVESGPKRIRYDSQGERIE